ncbi:MAG TPA: RNA polymerase sigma factor [Thermoanaerobaculia bacterium]|nr:RNA polymerase sigma factor [Thermoanaerobaculia bacterium]
MRIPDIEPELLAKACDGDLAALDEVVVAVQPGVFNLAVRILGNREDARDACQEILLKIVTRLSSFRGESAFGTWVWRVAHNHLMTAATRTRETVSLEEIGTRLEAGLAFGAAAGRGTLLTPEEKAEARDVAVNCTQGMLMALDRDQRLAYVLDVVFGLSSEEAAAVAEIEPAAHRKRLSRARARLEGFLKSTCGLVSPDVPCRCDRQLAALRAHARAEPLAPRVTRQEASAAYDALRTLYETTGVFRAHPTYAPPGALVEAIRAALGAVRPAPES